MRRISFCIVLCCSMLPACAAHASAFHIPNQMSLGNMQLYITPKAKKKIRQKIHTLVSSPKVYQTLLDRIALYMPTVEQILREERLPEDIKYLVIQESALVADAVSTSQAVGFWQMKQPAAAEVGLRIDGDMDERMHIITSTRGAARYLRSHYTFFNNWVHTLLAYYLGRTGAQQVIDKKRGFGVRKVKIDAHTHWYILHFLAHKLVFERPIAHQRRQWRRFQEYKPCGGKTLWAISQELQVAEPTLRVYNLWLKAARVPVDVPCGVVFLHQDASPVWEVCGRPRLPKPVVGKSSGQSSHPHLPARRCSQQVITPVVTYNGIASIQAEPHDTLDTLAAVGHITRAQLLAYNDIDATHCVQAGQVYYLAPKKNKVSTYYHIAQPGETWWQIAQQYGVKKKALLAKNRVYDRVSLVPGRVVWLRFTRPRYMTTAYEQKLVQAYFAR